ncbi:MAG: polymerase sigma-70 factor, subfamily [Acidimicrobiaceae bacterium]|jgi:RNA polymerase sigma-70 factor (ECF subfamily)|nr:polymerase sigma-70 factor, subfamily [Acidimicrobiaceae bacterium]
MDEVTGFALDAAAGDCVALQRFVRATQAQVWRFCAHLGDTGDTGDADDLTQEVYLRAIKALPRFRGDASARTWLLAIARTTVADHIRTLQRRRAASTSAAASARRTSPAASAAVVAAPDEHVVLRAVIGQLPEDRRTAFVLTQVLGLSYAEAAEVCRCPIGTIRSRVARARTELVSAIADEGEAGGDLSSSQLGG